jgi:hypothetical protein
MKTRLNRAALAVASLSMVLLSACGNGLSGTYGKRGEVNFEFHSNGKVELDVMGPVQEPSYVVEDGNSRSAARKAPWCCASTIKAASTAAR